MNMNMNLDVAAFGRWVVFINVHDYKAHRTHFM